MPNWAEGVIKVRGPRENITKFLTEGLVPIPRIDKSLAKQLNQDYTEPTVRQDISDDWIEISSEYGFMIPGARRAMIESDIEWYSLGKDIETLHIGGFKQAWGITDTTPYLELAKKYEIDIRIYVFEMGQEFNQELVIEDGEVKRFVDITFDDYEWECLFPNIGG